MDQAFDNYLELCNLVRVNHWTHWHYIIEYQYDKELFIFYASILKVYTAYPKVLNKIQNFRVYSC